MRAADHRHLEHAGMAQQHFFDLARINVAAAADDQVLGAVLQGEKTLVVEGCPCRRYAASRRARSRRSPADFASSRSSPLRRALDSRRFRRPASSRSSASATRTSTLVRGSPTEPMISRQRGRERSACSAFDKRRDRHRHFALAVDLREFRPEQIQSAQQCLEMHRRAAINDGAQTAMIGGGESRVVDAGG